MIRSIYVIIITSSVLFLWNVVCSKSFALSFHFQDESPFIVQKVHVSRVKTIKTHKPFTRVRIENSRVQVKEKANSIKQQQDTRNLTEAIKPNPSTVQEEKVDQTNVTTIQSITKRLQQSVLIWEGPVIPFDPTTFIPGTQIYYPNNTEHFDATQFLRRYRNHKRVESSTIDFMDYKRNSKPVYLFVVNFHFIFYKNIPYMENEYFGYFATQFNYDFDVVMVGPEWSQEYHVISNKLPLRGYYSYHSLTVALTCYPRNRGFNYAGAFLINDDSCIHPNFLNQYNLQNSHGEHINRWTTKDVWMWNTMKNQKKVRFARAYLNAITDLQQISFIQDTCHYDTNHLFRGWSDFFYISAKDIPLFLKIEDVLFDHRVFLENAVPTIMHCLNATQIVDCNHGRMPRIKTCVHLHPVKFSNENERSICMNRIKSIDLVKKPHVSYSFVCYT